MSDEGGSPAVSVRFVMVRGVPVSHVAGEIDMATVDAVRYELLTWLDDASSDVVIDLTGVTFMASAGLALLLDAAQHAQRCGVAFTLVAAHRAVLLPLRAAGMADLFTVHPNPDQAVHAVRSPPHLPRHGT